MRANQGTPLTPVARTETDRETKVQEILDAAGRRLLAGGYDDMSIAAISRELGLAQNTIYWYFPSKDHLFVAVLRQQLAKLAAKKPPASKGLAAQVIWATDQMHHLAAARLTLRERAEQSSVAAEFAKELDDLVRRLLMLAIKPYVDSAQLDVTATTLLATIEGTFAMGMSAGRRHRTLTHALNHLVPKAIARNSVEPHGKRPGS